MFIIPNNVILKVAQFYNVYKNTTYKLYYNTSNILFLIQITLINFIRNNQIISKHVLDFLI